MNAEEQYKTVCKTEFKEINDKLDSLMDKLFIDNGNECLQSKINRHNNWIKGMMGFLAGLWTVVLVVIAVLLRRWLF